VFVRNEYGWVADAKAIVDIGANIGSFTTWAAWTTQKERRPVVYAYEPFPNSFSLLEKNSAANKSAARVQAYRAAVAAKNGSAKLFLSENDISHSLVRNTSGPTVRSRSVKGFSLAHIVQSHVRGPIDILKLDCEGAEYAMLYACSPAILKQVQQIRLEYHRIENGEKNHAIRPLKAFLAKNGFRLVYEEQQGIGEGIAWFARSTTRRKST
jgi:FkbM family methyltransferase